MEHNSSANEQEVGMEKAGKQAKAVSASSAAFAELHGDVSYLETKHQSSDSQGTASMPFSKAMLTYWKWMLANLLTRG